MRSFIWRNNKLKRIEYITKSKIHALRNINYYCFAQALQAFYNRYVMSVLYLDRSKNMKGYTLKNILDAFSFIL